MATFKIRDIFQDNFIESRFLTIIDIKHIYTDY